MRGWTIMERRRHTPGQAVRRTRQGERLLNKGPELAEGCCATSRSRSRRSTAGARRRDEADEASRLETLEAESQCMKKLVAERDYTSMHEVALQPMV
jgi:hypothetical protein